MAKGYISNRQKNLKVGISSYTENQEVLSVVGKVGIGTVIDIVPYDTLSEGTLSFEGSAGQLFSITNNLTSGSIFSVNDISGIPSIDVDADGTVLIAPYGSTEYVGIGTTNPTSKLTVVGDGNFTGVVTASSFSGNASSATYATSAGIATYATSAGIATYATSAGVSTSVSGGIASITSLNVSGISTLGTLTVSSGIVTATTGIITYYGDGSKLTGLTAQARVVASQTPPTSPTEGDLWYHTTLARLFVYFNDGDSDQWVDAAPFNGGSGSGASVSVGATAPIGPLAGDLWYNSDYGRLFIYYSDVDSQQWVDAAPFNFSGITTATYTENSFVATAGQTSFTVSYEVGYVDVFINGIRLSSSEYTALDGSSVVLDDGATEGDVVDIIEVATNRGPTGARGADGSGGPLENVTETTDSSIHYPLFAVGIGTTLPYITTTSDYFEFIPSSGTLTVNQLNVGVTTLGVTTATNLTVQSINCSGVATATNLTVQSINCSGVATALDFNSTSDVNLKKDVKVIDNPVEKVSQLNGVSFNWTDTGQSSAGVIAQDVEKVMPEIIRNNPTGYKSLNYNGLIGLLIEAVKEQNETIKSLEQKINTLEERLS
jgi:hypothetical protein